MSNPPYAEQVMRALNTGRANPSRIERDVDSLSAIAPPRGLNVTGSIRFATVNLADSGYKDLGACRGFYLMRDGSEALGRVVADVGNETPPIGPGVEIRGPIGQLRLKRGDGSAETGIIRVALFLSDDARIVEPPVLTGKAIKYDVGPDGETSQAYNSPAGNVPIAENDGAPLQNAAAFKVLLYTSSGNIEAGGKIVLWFFNNGAWHESPFTYDVFDIAGAYATFGDEIVKLADGRVYAEARSVTNSGGDGDFVVSIVVLRSA